MIPTNLADISVPPVVCSRLGLSSWTSRITPATASAGAAIADHVRRDADEPIGLRSTAEPDRRHAGSVFRGRGMDTAIQPAAKQTTRPTRTQSGHGLVQTQVPSIQGKKTIQTTNSNRVGRCAT